MHIVCGLPVACRCRCSKAFEACLGGDGLAPLEPR